MKQFDRFRCLEPLGQGGMGRVYRAWDDRENAYVALKIVGESRTLDATMQSRFAREVDALREIDHPHVVRCLSPLLHEGDLLGYAMEYVVGMDTRQLIAEMLRFREPMACRMTTEALRGLIAVHQKNIVHRDMKPANILLDPHLRVRVTDFGLAHMAEVSSLTLSGQVLGTPRYMSPEQARGDAVDARSDLYAMGCVLYEMLDGSPPFDAPSAYEIMRKHVEDPVPTIEHASQAVNAVIERALNKKPEDRYSSAREMLDDLLPLTEAEEPGDRQDDEATRVLITQHAVSPPAPAPAHEATGHTNHPPRVRRSRMGWIAGLLVTLFLVGMCALRSPTRKETSPSRPLSTFHRTDSTSFRGSVEQIDKERSVFIIRREDDEIVEIPFSEMDSIVNEGG